MSETVLGKDDYVQVVAGALAGARGHIRACPAQASAYFGLWECEEQGREYVYVVFDKAVQSWNLGGTALSAEWQWCLKDSVVKVVK
jgi:hypothetical protein